MDEYDHYLDLLDDEADSQDEELAIRLAQATSRPKREEHQSFHDYQLQREGFEDTKRRLCFSMMQLV